MDDGCICRFIFKRLIPKKIYSKITYGARKLRYQNFELINNERLPEIEI